MKNKNLIRKINKELIQETGGIKPFAQQLLEYEYGTHSPSSPFVISNITPSLNKTPLYSYPLIILQSTVKKIKNKHDLSNTVLLSLEKMLKNNVLAIQSRKHKDSLVVVTNCSDSKGYPIIISIRRGFRVGYIQTNQITSVYGKRRLRDLIEASFRDGCEFYANEKTVHWLSSQRFQLPPDVTSALSYNKNIPYAAHCQEENSVQKNSLDSLDDQLISASLRRNKNNHIHALPIKTKKNVWDVKK